MTVERDVTIVLADAEMNDEGGVDVTLVDQTVAVSIAEARALASDLLAAAADAEVATLDAVVHEPEPLASDLAVPVGTVFGGEQP